MKSLTYFLLLVLSGMFCFSSCEDTSASKVAETVKDLPKAVNVSKNKKAKPQPQPPAGAIGLKQAQDWVRRYEKTDLTTFTGFTLPAADLKGVLDEVVDSARFYIGQESSGEYKLIVVGVSSNGKDMIDSTATPPQYIYDFSTPCPPCGDLIGGGGDQLTTQ